MLPHGVIPCASTIIDAVLVPIIDTKIGAGAVSGWGGLEKPVRAE